MTGVAAPLSPPDTEAMRLHRLMTGYLSSKALFSAVELRLFDLLEAAPCTVEELADDLRIPQRPARALLLALQGEALVAQVDGRYRNEPVSSTYLVTSSPRYMGLLAHHQATHFAKLTRLDEALRDDQPVRLGEGYTGEFKTGPQAWARQWAEVFRASSLLMADDLASQADLRGYKHLVDLGCASCAYSISLARAHPQVQVTAVDQPAVAEVAREFVAEADMSDRIAVHGANIFEETFGDCDVALLSHVIQGFDQARAAALIKHVYDWLPQGGQLLLHTHLPERSALPFPYQFGLILLINNNQGGEPHGEELTRRWLTDAGFHDIQVSEVSPISALLRATK